MLGAGVSKLDVTTQELFQRLGTTSQLRRSRADALFRRLRFDKQDQIADALMRAPRRLDAADVDGSPTGAVRAAKRALKKAMKTAP